MSDFEDIFFKKQHFTDDQKFWMIIESLEKWSGSLELIANGIDSGLSLIADQLKHNNLTNEYYLILGRIIELKEKHPDVKFEIKICSNRYALEEPMRIALAWLFSKAPGFKNEFNTDCLIGECPANKWFMFMLCNAELYREYERGHYNECVSIVYRNQRGISIIHNSFFKEGSSYTNGVQFDEKLFHSLVNKLSSVYGKHNLAKYCSIADGTQYINAWLAERYCETMISALKNAYSSAVIKILEQ